VDFGKITALLIIYLQLRQILEKLHQYNISLHQLQIDFDSICRFLITETMKECGVPAKLISLTNMTLSRTYTKVQFQNKFSTSFRMDYGIRQGDSLFTLLFNTGL
jgi:hypothetical protein